jgi:hypothetical protein
MKTKALVGHELPRRAAVTTSALRVCEVFDQTTDLPICAYLISP